MPAPITISVPGSGNVSLVTAQQLTINFTEAVFMCYSCTTATNLFVDASFPASGSQHAKDSSWSGMAIEVTENQTIEFWTGSNAGCPETTAATKRSITVGSTSKQVEEALHAVGAEEPGHQSEVTKHSITVGSTS